MEGHKDISEMSFEEFFSEKDRSPVQQEPRVRRDAPRRSGGGQKGDVQMGFGAVIPKINYSDHSFFLYVPRYGSDANARFEVAIDCSAGVVPLGRLDSSPRGTGRLSRAATFNLTAEGISPLEQFTLIIDGQEVYRMRNRGILFFNNIGLPMGKPVGDTLAVYPKGKSLRVVKTDLGESFDIGDVTVTRADVSTAGGIWLDDRRRPERPHEDVDAPSKEEAQEVPQPATEEPKAKAKPKAKRKKATGTIRLPSGIPEADAMVDGEVLPVFSRFPAFSVSVENRELQECQVSLEDASGNAIAGGNPPVDAPMTFETDADGLMSVVLSCDGQVLARSRLVYIPDFVCDRPGKGDICEEPTFSYTAFGESGERDAADGPSVFSRGGVDITVCWNVPAVTYDVGAGPVRLGSDVPEIDVDQLGDVLTVTVTGARKKAVFLGSDKGKKRDITPDWMGDTYRIPMGQVSDEVYESDAPQFTLYITVNSFPMRRFMVIRNPVRVKASFSDGNVVADVAANGEFVCRIFKIDKTVETVALQPGSNTVPVPADAVEAEVVEVRNGSDRTTVQVGVRDLPFLWRDEMGDIWLYVSKTKRIPLPGDLSSGKPAPVKVRQWHDQIVRMNPELRNVSSEMMQKAFDRMVW